MAYCRELDVILFPVVFLTNRHGRAKSLGVAHVVEQILGQPYYL